MPRHNLAAAQPPPPLDESHGEGANSLTSSPAMSSDLPLRLNSTSSSTSLRDMPSRNRKLRLLVAATGPREASWALALVVRLSNNPNIEMKAIVEHVVPRLTQTITAMPNKRLTQEQNSDDIAFYRQQAYKLVKWADLLVCVPLEALDIGKMLAGVDDTFLGKVIRGWDITKRIVLVPGMDMNEWSNPTTKRHLSKIHRKWNWIRVMGPILWHWEGTNEGAPVSKPMPNWNGFDELLSIIQNQADLLGLGREVQVATSLAPRPDSDTKVKAKLPPEIWTIILNYVGDWELAKALRVYTNLPTPRAWREHSKETDDPLKAYASELAWTTLTCNSAAICKKISESPPNFHDLPALVVKLVIRFALIPVLQYMEANRPDLFAAFDGSVLPINASAYYPRLDVLDYWRQSRWFHDRHHTYTHEALDGASRNGHVRILDWWLRRSGFQLRYTESALEQASANGHLLVLEWWRDAAAQDEDVVLRPGRSILWCTQFGRANVLRWWDASGIPVAHGDGVAKLASRWGQVEVLETWRRLKGDNKLVYDSEVLRDPTVHGYVGVLEWWRKFAHGELEGMEGRTHPVEFRTCNIEEALEDSVGDQQGVRQWWAQNGLNLGVRNEEWLKTRYL